MENLNDILMFPELADRKLYIKAGEAYYECDPLPVTAEDTINRIYFDCLKAENGLDKESADYMEQTDAIFRPAKEKLIVLIAPQIPEQLRENLGRLDFWKLHQLATYLWEADDPNLKPPAKKKVIRMS